MSTTYDAFQGSFGRNNRLQSRHLAINTFGVPVPSHVLIGETCKSSPRQGHAVLSDGFPHGVVNVLCFDPA